LGFTFAFYILSFAMLNNTMGTSLLSASTRLPDTNNSSSFLSLLLFFTIETCTLGI
jgi:hypothetical protein